jgi:hypothetical protein
MSAAHLVTILLIQRRMRAPDDTAIADDFRRAAHRALDV